MVSISNIVKALKNKSGKNNQTRQAALGPVYITPKEATPSTIKAITNTGATATVVSGTVNNPSTTSYVRRSGGGGSSYVQTNTPSQTQYQQEIERQRQLEKQRQEELRKIESQKKRVEELKRQQQQRLIENKRLQQLAREAQAEKGKTAKEELLKNSSIKRQLEIERQRQQNQKVGLYVPPVDKSGKSEAYYIQQKIQKEINNHMDRVFEKLTNWAKEGKISVDKANKLLEKEYNRKYNQIVAELNRIYPQKEVNFLLERVNSSNQKLRKNFGLMGASNLKTQVKISKSILKNPLLKKWINTPKFQQILKEGGFGKLGPNLEQSLSRIGLPGEGAEYLIKKSTEGWEDMLFSKRGFNIKKEGLVAQVPSVLSGSFQIASYLIPGVGSGILVSDISRLGKTYIYPMSDVNKILNSEYNQYKKEVELGENERHLTKDEFSKLASPIIINEVKRAALGSIGLTVLFFGLGRGLKRILQMLKNSGLGVAAKNYLLKVEKRIGRKLTTTEKGVALTVKFGGKLTRSTEKNISSLQKSILNRTGKKVIEGVKVSSKEAKSFKEAVRKVRSLKNLGKLGVENVQSKGGVGIQGGPREIKTLLTKELLMAQKRGLLSIRNSPLGRARKYSITKITQRYQTDVPKIIKINGKKPSYRVDLQTKTFYQNSVAVSLKDKSGKDLGSLIFNIVSDKPLPSFRTLKSLLDYGKFRSIVLSKSTGNNLVRSISLDIRKNGKKKLKEYISRFKINKKGNYEIIKQETRLKGIGKRPSKQFRTGAKVSKSLIVSKNKPRTTIKRDGKLKIINKRNVKALRIATKREPVILSNRKTEIIKRLDKLLKRKLTKNTKKKIIKLRKNLKNRSFNPSRFKRDYSKVKNNLSFKNSRIKEINKQIQRELKESLAGSSAGKLKVSSRERSLVQREFRKLRNARSNLLKARTQKAVISAIVPINRIIENLKQSRLNRSQLELLNQVRSKVKQAVSSLQDQSSKLNLKQLKLDKVTKKKLEEINVNLGKIIIPLIKVPPIKIKRPTDQIKTTKKIKKIFKFRGGSERRTTSSGKQIGYNVFIKSGRKFIKANTVPLSRINAENRAAYIVDHTTSVTAKIRPTKSVKKLGIITSKEFGARSKIKARDYRIIRGKRKQLTGTIIERKGKPRINTRGEKRGLRAARLIKQLQPKSKKKVTGNQRKELLKRLAKARAVRMRNLRRKRR